MDKGVHLNIEDELAKAITDVGGIRLSEVLGRAPGFENADFYFPTAGVVAELKCLDEDKMRDERLVEKASALYLQELRSGRAPGVVFGTVDMTTAGFSPEFTENIMWLYRVPIERVFRKADRQLAQSKRALGRQEAKGLLLVANNNHRALDPWHAWKLMGDILSTPEYTSIDAAVLFAGNLGATVPGHASRVDYWITFQRAHSEVSEAFLSVLREAWFKQLGTRFGTSVRSIELHDAVMLAKLESR